MLLLLSPGRSIPQRELAKRSALRPLAADVEPVRPLVLALKYELRRLARVADGVLHLPLRFGVHALRVVERRLLVARGPGLEVAEAHLLEALLALRSAEELLWGVAAGRVGGEDPCRRVLCEVGLDRVGADSVFV